MGQLPASLERVWGGNANPGQSQRRLPWTQPHPATLIPYESHQSSGGVSDPLHQPTNSDVPVLRGAVQKAGELDTGVIAQTAVVEPEAQQGPRGLLQHLERSTGI